MVRLQVSQQSPINFSHQIIRHPIGTFSQENHYFVQRAKFALRASSDLSLAESLAIRALPPLRPPSLPKATAAGFFFLSVVLLERLGMR